MTTIAVRNGIMAADSQVTCETEAGGSRYFRCTKMYPKVVRLNDAPDENVIIGVSGDGFAALVFVDWYGSGKDKPNELIEGEADFSAIVLTSIGLFEYDRWCRGEKVLEEFYAIGSGTKAALGAMHAGCSAKRAVEIACRVDSYSRLPVTALKLKVSKNAKP